MKADAATAVAVFTEYFTTFVPVLQWFSYQAPYFCNTVMETLAATLGARHRFSTAYVPWSNGTAEAVCKKVLRVFLAKSPDMMIPETEWPTVFPAIQTVVNNSPSCRLDGRAPITVHTRMTSGNPLSIALTVAQLRCVSSINEAELIQKRNIN